MFSHHLDNHDLKMSTNDFGRNKSRKTPMRTRSIKLTSLLLLTIGMTHFKAAAQTNASSPLDYGTVVNGFQDNFTNVTRDPGWVPVNAANEDPYVQTNGVLRVFSPTNYENPDHLIYNPTPVTYDGAIQEVLARIRVVKFDWNVTNQGDQLFGLGLSCQGSNTNQPYGGNNVLLMDLDGWDDTGDPNFASTPPSTDGYQLRTLNDYVAWGPGLAFMWTTNQWYWMRVGSDGVSLNGKLWPDDGVTPEPADWQLSWTLNGYDSPGYDAYQTNRIGFAGLTGSHTAGIEYEVDYFLLKASGLPSITVNPTPDPLYFTSQPQNSTNAVGTTATFSVTVSNLAPVSYQWSKAPSGSTTFAAIAGATNASYTTPALSTADNGNQYSVFVSEGSVSDDSQVATLSIDTTAPTLIYAMSLGSSTQVVLQFSEPVRIPGTLSGFSATGLTFSSVGYGSLPSQLVLTSSAMTFATSNTLNVSGVKDLAGNQLATTNLPITQGLQLPSEFGTTVSGYQDDFTGASINPAWTAVPNDPAVMAQFTQANGLLNFTTDTNTTLYDPEHLLYEPTTAYDSTNQEVLARIRINSAYEPNIGIRLGVAGLCDPASASPGEGANAQFAYTPGTGIIALITIDGVGQDPVNIGSTSTAEDLFPQIGQWYWLRAKCTYGSNIAVKFWLGDGVTPEPADFQLTDSFKASIDSPLYAGISAVSADAVVDFDVDYILIEADGLPSISVTPPSDLGFGPYIYFTQQPIGGTVSANTPFTLTVATTGSAAPTYQWQSAPPGSSTFSDIAGQTSTNLTESLAVAQSGTQYRVIASVPGLNLDSATVTIISGPPVLLAAQTLGNPTNVTLTFSRAVQVPTNTANFSIDNSVTISSVAAGITPNILILTTSPLTLGTTYTLSASGVNDNFGNTLTSTNIPVSFTVYLPAELGASVSGYQDNFSASTLNTNWLAVGLDPENGDNLFLQDGDGLLHISSATNAFESNPNLLLYNGPAYNSASQEVLMRLRITAFAPSTFSGAAYGDGLDSIGGATVGADPNVDFGTSGTNTAGGLDWMLVGTEGGSYTGIQGLQAAFLNDWIAWGSAASYDWTTNQWYWLRELQTGTSIADGPNLFGKVWVADGTTPEPAAWQAAWSQTNRTGLAGIKASSANKVGETTVFNFDVSYFLLKAAGLPTITVAPPSSFSLIPPSSPLQFTGIQSSSNSVVLEWTGAGTIQQATSLAGPWTDLVDPNGAFSPYTIPAGSPAEFYRLRQ